ncbi:GNAT family N-acetyltransferase [Streptosporangium sandarakinum]|uniref:GNAT family N-acetyltransferase n=1 Tax=Streptosporangium sandarakinum TaxID=1260955 RepID=UPI003429742E
MPGIVSETSRNPGADTPAGCARVSTRGQDHQSRLDALAGAHCREVAVETANTHGEQPKLRATLDRLQPGHFPGPSHARMAGPERHEDPHAGRRPGRSPTGTVGDGRCRTRGRSSGGGARWVARPAAACGPGRRTARHAAPVPRDGQRADRTSRALRHGGPVGPPVVQDRDGHLVAALHAVSLPPAIVANAADQGIPFEVTMDALTAVVKIRAVAVDGPSRGQGIGSALLTRCLQWTGEIRMFAVRHLDDLIAHVAVGVRHGTTMVYLRWQGPAGSDPAAALRTGHAAIMRTLGRLPAGG